MKAIEAVQGRLRALPMLWCALVAAIVLSTPARAGETGSTDEFGGTAALNSILLDPFDPVPNVGFEHGWGRDHGRRCDHEDCDRDREPPCLNDCHWHGWYCPHDCYAMHARDERGEYNLGWWRCANDCRDGDWWCDHDCRLEGWHCEHNCFIHEPCEHDCGNRPPFPRCDRGRDCRLEGDRCRDICYGMMVHAYQEYDERLRRYDEQAHWYFEHVMDDRRHDFDHHDMDHRSGDHRDLDHHDLDHHGDYDRHDSHDFDHGRDAPPPPPPVGMTGPGGPQSAAPTGPGPYAPGAPPQTIGGPPPGAPGAAPSYGPGPSPDGPTPYSPPPH